MYWIDLLTENGKKVLGHALFKGRETWILKFFLVHICNNLIPLYMVVHLKFNLLYDLVMKYMIKMFLE